jgi:hypothetical protein
VENKQLVKIQTAGAPPINVSLFSVRALTHRRSCTRVSYGVERVIEVFLASGVPPALAAEVSADIAVLFYSVRLMSSHVR